MFDQTMNSHTFTLEAAPENFAAAQKQVRAFLEPCSCSMRTLLELDMLVEEIFINIANYAYPNGTGTAAIDLALNDNNDTLTITFRDKGIPYNPLENLSRHHIACVGAPDRRSWDLSRTEVFRPALLQL